MRELSKTQADVLQQLINEDWRAEGPWQVERLTNVIPPWFVRPYTITYEAWRGHFFATEAEALAVRDALNRVAREMGKP